MTLCRKLHEVFGGFRPDCVLFSGGLDSAAAAALAGCTKGIIVTLGEDAPDLKYARLAARALHIDLTHVVVSREQALDALPEVISGLKSFDPAIPNDMTVYFGLKRAQAMGFRSTLTGDGSDEIFGGYSYMRDIDDLDTYILRLSGVMSFNANRLGEHFGIGIMQPFLHPDIINCALAIGREWKVREMNGTVHGKWVLREALKGVLPDEILWQDKRPLETGSGMAELNTYFDGSISGETFYRRIRQHGIYFMNKAHSQYYEIYRHVVGEIPPPGNDERPCPGCGAGIKKHRGHCRVCGWVERGLP
jgi:asparagine synthase (glutamine-hydrolysing)